MALTRALSMPLDLLKKAAFEPLVTGPLLLVLLQGPENLRQPILNLIKSERFFKVSTAITALKWLFGLGLTSRVNTLLNHLCLNHWNVKRPGLAWSFDRGGVDEIIVITGGCSGFGLTMTKMFSERAPRAKLVIIDLSPLPEELKTVPNLSYYKANLTETATLLETCTAIKTTVGAPTILINNAGTANKLTNILDLSMTQLQHVFAVNTFSHVPLIQAFLPAMLEGKKGHIVTFASMASYVINCSMADYCGSKAATLSLHEGLVEELKYRYTNGKCINVSVMHPTWADTGLTKAWMKPFGETTTREEVAGIVVEQVLAGKSGQLFAPKSMGNVLYGTGMPVWVKMLARRGLEGSTR